MRDHPEVKAYMEDGMSYEQACSLANVRVVIDVFDDAVIDVNDFDMSVGDDVDLIEENGRLAIKVVNRALKRGCVGDIDGTVLQAAVRAVSMLEERRKVEGSNDPEDDMLLWVDRVMQGVE